MRFFLASLVALGCLSASAMPLGLRTALWGEEKPELNLFFDEAYETESDGSLILVLTEAVDSELSPKLTVKGLPSGLKYDATSMTISGKATKPGVYQVTVSATNATVKQPVTATFQLVVPNLVSEKLPGLEQETDAYGIVTCGVAFDPGLSTARRRRDGP